MTMQTKHKRVIVTGEATGIGAGVTNASFARRIGWLWYEVTSAALTPLRIAESCRYL